jgi:hypothetical protein
LLLRQIVVGVRRFERAALFARAGSDLVLSLLMTLLAPTSSSLLMTLHKFRGVDYYVDAVNAPTDWKKLGELMHKSCTVEVPVQSSIEV